MSDPKTPNAAGTDWTRLLTDPELVSHLGELLQIYRDAPLEKRDQALLGAMREIKSARPATAATDSVVPALAPEPRPVPTAPAATPPFEPDIFTPSLGQDRRKYPRIKCFVAVELRMSGSETPIWGNLSNTGLGGCYVETVTPVKSGVGVELGLWLANGKIWVKGIVLNGTVTQSNPCFGVRIRFADLEPTARESLRQFLKFVESTTKGYQQQHGYLAQLKK